MFFLSSIMVCPDRGFELPPVADFPYSANTAEGANSYKSFAGHTYAICYFYVAVGNDYRKWHYNGKFG